MRFCCYSCVKKWTRYEGKHKEMQHLKFRLFYWHDTPLPLGTNMQRGTLYKRTHICMLFVLCIICATLGRMMLQASQRRKAIRHARVPQWARMLQTSCGKKLQQKCTYVQHVSTTTNKYYTRITLKTADFLPLIGLPMLWLLLFVAGALHTYIHMCQCYKLAELKCVAFFAKQKPLKEANQRWCYT